MLDDLRRVFVNFEPGERIAEDAAMRNRPLRPGTRAEVAQPALQADDLSQAFDVAPRERELTELRSGRTPVSGRIRLTAVRVGG